MAKPKPGGLNEYGIASYKAVDGFAQAEVEWLLRIGGIELRHGQGLGQYFTLGELRDDFDAVFLGVGLAGVNGLGLGGGGQVDGGVQGSGCSVGGGTGSGAGGTVEGRRRAGGLGGGVAARVVKFTY